MFKKVLFTLGLLSLVLFGSCSNMAEGEYGSNQLAFGIGDAAANVIGAEIKSNEIIDDDTKLNVQCELLRGETVIDKQSVTTALKDLDSASFSLKNIPNGNSYYILIKIYYNNIVIYDALSDVIILREGQEEANVSLQLEQRNSRIDFDLCGGSFKEGDRYPTSYFISSSIALPVPEKAHFQFDGWYLSDDFAPENKVESLGKTCFLGDVTLYAKWIKLNQVSTVRINPDSGKFDLGDTITLETSTQGATIYYTTDGTVPTTSSSLYDSGITITESMIQNDKVVIKAFAVKEGMENSDVALKTFTQNKYAITYETGCDIPIAKKTVVYNYALTSSDLSGDSLTKTEHSFQGWYNGNTKVKAGDKVTGDIKLTADWKINQYTITYETGCDKTIAKKTVDYNYVLTDLDLSGDSLTKAGHSFQGWHSGMTKIKAGDKVTGDMWKPSW